MYYSGVLILENYSVKMVNQWQPSIDCDIYHQFSIELGTECVLKEYKKKGKKIVISPIMWNLFPKNSFRWNLTKEVFNLADLIMTNSLAESQRLSEDFGIPEKKFYKTRNSISADYLNSSTSEDFKKKFNIDGDFILTVANIDERKNTKTLIDACIGLNLNLVIIGAIRDQNYFNTFKDKSKFFRFLGPVFDKDTLKSAYQQCKLFILPSLCETPGLSALEAASQGADIIITGEGATREYFQDKVSYFDPKEPSSLAPLISKTLNLQVERSNNDLSDFIRNNFSWRDTANDISRGYEELFK